MLPSCPFSSTCVTPEISSHTHPEGELCTTINILCFICTSAAFFAHPAAGLFSCSRLRGTHGACPNTTAQVWALAEIRGTCSGGSKLQVPTGRHSEHVQPFTSMQSHVQVKKCPTAHLISRILSRQALLDGKIFSRHQLARHATAFSTIKVNQLNDLGRIVSSHAGPCVEDMTAR